MHIDFDHILFIIVSHDIPLNTQKINNISEVINSDDTVLKNSTNDGIIDVMLEPIPYPAKLNFDSMKFELSFLKPNTSQLQDHVDFNLKIFKNDKQVFQANNQTGQPSVPLHATDGYMTIPMLNYQFDQAGCLPTYYSGYYSTSCTTSLAT